jgi:hypothetical protein
MERWIKTFLKGTKNFSPLFKCELFNEQTNYVLRCGSTLGSADWKPVCRATPGVHGAKRITPAH